jgi:hypothetical protein
MPSFFAISPIRLMVAAWAMSISLGTAFFFASGATLVVDIGISSGCGKTSLRKV